MFTTTQLLHSVGNLPTLQRGRIPLLTENRSFGREAELAAVAKTLTDESVRLLTLTGPAGVGKSRLAREAAALVAPAFSEGVVVVDLSDIGSSAEAWSRISRMLGGEAVGTPEALVAAVAFQEVLPVLDGCDLLISQMGPT
ncbi:AAA family ATPase [Streptomyces sp. NPDC000410]|uniref:AAA family ATPase n=1 Tax=Streptomyces sp. NPDC000410 TaxID=3154254 RepID=UPI00332A9B1A